MTLLLPLLPSFFLRYLAHLHDIKGKMSGRDLLLYAKERQDDKQKLSTFETKFHIREESARREMQEEVCMLCAVHAVCAVCCVLCAVCCMCCILIQV